MEAKRNSSYYLKNTHHSFRELSAPSMDRSFCQTSTFSNRLISEQHLNKSRRIFLQSRHFARPGGSNRSMSVLRNPCNLTSLISTQLPENVTPEQPLKPILDSPLSASYLSKQLDEYTAKNYDSLHSSDFQD